MYLHQENRRPRIEHASYFCRSLSFFRSVDTEQDSQTGWMCRKFRYPRKIWETETIYGNSSIVLRCLLFYPYKFSFPFK